MCAKGMWPRWHKHMWLRVVKSSGSAWIIWFSEKCGLEIKTLFNFKSSTAQITSLDLYQCPHSIKSTNVCRGNTHADHAAEGNKPTNAQNTVRSQIIRGWRRSNAQFGSDEQELFSLRELNVKTCPITPWRRAWLHATAGATYRQINAWWRPLLRSSLI